MSKITKEEFAKRIKMHQSDMYRLAFSILRTEVDAQDAVSETIVKAFEHRGNLRDIENFKSWIMQIVANESKNLLRHKKRLIYVEDNKIQERMQQIYEPKEIKDHGLWETVMQLEDEYRAIVVLFYYENYSTKEISRMMKLPEGTVKSRLSRAREKLKSLV